MAFFYNPPALAAQCQVCPQFKMSGILPVRTRAPPYPPHNICSFPQKVCVKSHRSKRTVAVRVHRFKRKAELRTRNPTGHRQAPAPGVRKTPRATILIFDRFYSTMPAKRNAQSFSSSPRSLGNSRIGCRPACTGAPSAGENTSGTPGSGDPRANPPQPRRSHHFVGNPRQNRGRGLGAAAATWVRD